MSRRPIVVIAGQIPPPLGGQAIMIERLLVRLGKDMRLDVRHLPFNFTKDFDQARKAGPGKLFELLRVLLRLLRLRLRSRIDALVYPSGGPQRVPLLRDILLLPWVLLAAETVILHFHAGGIADKLQRPNPLSNLVRFLYSRCRAAVVMTSFNRRDPLACDISHIGIFPHRLPDSRNQSLVNHDGVVFKILYVGNIHEDKGITTLLKALNLLKRECPDISLELAGDFVAPYSKASLQEDIVSNDLCGAVHFHGVVSGHEKALIFAAANVFAFPSVAPSESFGIVLVEAMMWGIPIVASDWRGNGDVLAGSDDNILFYPPDSAEALYKGLKKVYLRWKDGALGGDSNRRKFLEKFHDDGMPDELNEFIFECAAHRANDGWPVSGDTVAVEKHRGGGDGLA